MDLEFAFNLPEVPFESLVSNAWYSVYERPTASPWEMCVSLLMYLPPSTQPTLQRPPGCWAQRVAQFVTTYTASGFLFWFTTVSLKSAEMSHSHCKTNGPELSTSFLPRKPSLLTAFSILVNDTTICPDAHARNLGFLWPFLLLTIASNWP